MDRKIIEVFEPAYPGLNFHAPDEYSQKIAEKNPPYATYRIGLFFGGNDTDQPFDFRQTGLYTTLQSSMMPVTASQRLNSVRLRASRQEPDCALVIIVPC